MTHLAHGLDAADSGWAYLTAELMWSYLMPIALGYAAWTTARRARGFTMRAP